MGGGSLQNRNHKLHVASYTRYTAVIASQKPASNSLPEALEGWILRSCSRFPPRVGERRHLWAKSPSGVSSPGADRGKTRCVGERCHLWAKSPSGVSSPGADRGKTRCVDPGASGGPLAGGGSVQRPLKGKAQGGASACPGDLPGSPPCIFLWKPLFGTPTYGEPTKLALAPRPNLPAIPNQHT